MAELIREDDTLNQGRKKLNNAIKAFNETVVEGDSSVEAAQARVDKDGKTYETLKSRLDSEQEDTEENINEFRDDVTTQLADTEQELNEINETFNDKVIAVDLQGIDSESLKKNNEILPVELMHRRVVISTVINEKIDSSHNRSVYIDMNTLRDFKSYDFLVNNESISDVRIAITPSYSSTSTAPMNIAMSDGSFEVYGNGSADVHHLIPSKTRGVLLSHVLAKNSEGKEASVKKPY